MKIKEIRAASSEDLKSKLIELKKERMKINAQLSTGTTPKSPGQIKQMKKTIARILTVLKQKEKNTKEEKRKA